MPGPVATIGSMHVCPMSDGPKPHVGGPIIGPGAPNVMINGKSVALLGDMCTCMSAPDVIAMGSPSVFVNGVPVVCQGDLTAHGGVIVQGEPNVIIGTATPLPPVKIPVSKIPFPKISLKNRVLSSVTGKSNAEAKANQDKLKEEEEGEPRIFNLQWVKEDRVIRESRVLREVTLRAMVQNIPDGESITFKVKRPIEEMDEDGNKIISESDVIELSGTVKDKMVEVVWEVEDASKDESESEHS